MENIPSDRGIILCANHRCYFDPVFVGVKLKRELRFMAKVELFHKPVLGALIKKLGAFPVKRGTGDMEAVTKAIDTVKNGGVFAIFPEGTRSKTGEMGKFKSGAVLVASKTDGDIVPCYIQFEGKLRFRSKVTVTFGKVIKNEEFKIDEVTPSTLRTATRFLQEKVVALRKEA